jgi:L-ascorbate metabolism protein UlaG (beta-lactamase superfamily)
MSNYNKTPPKKHRRANSILVALILLTLIWLVWPAPETYVKNNTLTTLRPTWPGNLLIGHRLSSHTYANMPEALGSGEYNPTRIQDRSRLQSWTWFDELRLKILKNRQQNKDPQDPFTLPSSPLSDLWQNTDNTVVWLGHASFFIRLDGITFLTDPSYGPSAGGYPRLLPEPAADQLRGLDYILLSSNQPYHANKQTLAQLRAHNPSTIILAPLGLPQWLNEPAESDPLATPDLIQEAGWFQQYHTYGHVTVTLMPARSWSGPTLSERDRTLWGSFIVQTPVHTLYFAGSSGWGGHYDQIARHFPDIDYAFIPIGAYQPESVMSKSHLTPDDVARLCQTLHPKHIIPMSYGTYDLACEPLSEPLEKFQELAAAGLLGGEAHILEPGQIFALP